VGEERRVKFMSIDTKDNDLNLSPLLALQTINSRQFILPARSKRFFITGNDVREATSMHTAMCMYS
jgi:hypothetical protein